MSRDPFIIPNFPYKKPGKPIEYKRKGKDPFAKVEAKKQKSRDVVRSFPAVLKATVTAVNALRNVDVQDERGRKWKQVSWVTTSGAYVPPAVGMACHLGFLHNNPQLPFAFGPGGGYCTSDDEFPNDVEVKWTWPQARIDRQNFNVVKEVTPITCALGAGSIEKFCGPYDDYDYLSPLEDQYVWPQEWPLWEGEWADWWPYSSIYAMIAYAINNHDHLVFVHYDQEAQKLRVRAVNLSDASETWSVLLPRYDTYDVGGLGWAPANYGHGLYHMENHNVLLVFPNTTQIYLFDPPEFWFEDPQYDLNPRRFCRILKANTGELLGTALFPFDPQLGFSVIDNYFVKGWWSHYYEPWGEVIPGAIAYDETPLEMFPEFNLAILGGKIKNNYVGFESLWSELPVSWRDTFVDSYYNGSLFNQWAPYGLNTPYGSQLAYVKQTQSIVVPITGWLIDDASDPEGNMYGWNVVDPGDPAEADPDLPSQTFLEVYSIKVATGEKTRIFSRDKAETGTYINNYAVSQAEAHSSESIELFSGDQMDENGWWPHLRLPDKIVYTGLPKDQQYDIGDGGIAARYSPTYIEKVKNLGWGCAPLFKDDTWPVQPPGGWAAIEEIAYTFPHIRVWPHYSGFYPGRYKYFNVTMYDTGWNRGSGIPITVDFEGNLYFAFSEPDEYTRFSISDSAYDSNTVRPYTRLKRWIGSKSTTIKDSEAVAGGDGTGGIPITEFLSSPPPPPYGAFPYVVDPPGGGAWVGQGNKFAVRSGLAWNFYTPGAYVANFLGGWIGQNIPTMSNDGAFQLKYTGVYVVDKNEDHLYWDPAESEWSWVTGDEPLAKDPDDFDYKLVPILRYGTPSYIKVISLKSSGAIRWEISLSQDGILSNTIHWIIATTKNLWVGRTYMDESFVTYNIIESRNRLTGEVLREWDIGGVLFAIFGSYAYSGEQFVRSLYDEKGDPYLLVFDARTTDLFHEQRLAVRLSYNGDIEIYYTEDPVNFPGPYSFGTSVIRNGYMYYPDIEYTGGIRDKWNIFKMKL